MMGDCSHARQCRQWHEKGMFFMPCSGTRTGSFAVLYKLLANPSQQPSLYMQLHR